MAFSFYDLIPLTLFITAALYAVLGLHAWKRRPAPAVTSFAWLMLAMSLWAMTYGLEIYFPQLSVKLLWVKFEYIGIVSLPPLWLMFILEYTGQNSLFTRRNMGWLWAIPFIALLLVWTDDLHHLFFLKTPLDPVGNLFLLTAEYGLAFWVFLAYLYLLLAWGSILLVVQTLRSPHVHRGQAIAILLAVLAPWVSGAIYIAGIFPIPGLDLTTFAFIPTGIILTWAITRYRLLDIIPPAQSAILQNLSDGVILLDCQRRVLFMNIAAENILSAKAEECLGQPAEDVCPAPSKAIVSLWGSGEKFVETTLTASGQPRQYEIHISPMQTADKPAALESVSHLVVFHDVTEQKQAESALLRREAILRAVSVSSEQFIKSASWEKNVQTVLEQMGRAADASRVYIFAERIDNGVSLLDQRYEWVAESVQAQIENPNLQNLPWREVGFARWADELEQHRTISGPVREFPASEQELLKQQEILSVAIIPIAIEERLWGFIGFDDCQRERRWGEAELDALRAAAGIFGAALTRREIEQRLVRDQNTQELLQDIIRAALGKNEIQEMAEYLVHSLGHLLGAEYCFLSRWDERRRRTIPLATYGVIHQDFLNITILPGEKNLTASALEAGQMLVVDDALNSPHISNRLAEAFHLRSALAIPLISDEKKLGSVLFAFSRPHQFTSEEVLLGEKAAELVTLAFAKFQAVEEAHRRAEEAETLRRAGASISETLNLQEAITRILEQLAYVVPHDSASVQLLRDGELEIVGGEGWANPASVIGVRFPIPGNNPNTVVIQTRKPYLLNDTYEAFIDFRKIVHASHIRSWLGVPLVVRNQIIGLLAIDSREINHFTEDDAELATVFAGHVAVAIENARLFDEVQQLAITDGLTGLYNRHHFMELAQNEFERARRYKRHLTAMMFDIDHFKIVNDTYGHPFGDKVLQAIASLCKDKLREADPIARYGGEEFIALIVEANLASTKKVGERLRREVEKLVIHNGKGDVRITVSVGIAEQNQDTPTLESLIARVDQALYVAKHKGRNRVILGK